MSDMGLPDPTGLNEAMAPAIEEIRDEAHDIIGRGGDALYDTIMGPEGDHYRTGVENFGRGIQSLDRHLGRPLEGWVKRSGEYGEAALDFIGPFTWLDEWLLGTKEEREQDARRDSADYYDSDGGDLTEQGTGRETIKEIHFDSMSKETAFIKFINWLTGHGISRLEREGAPLGQSILLGGTQFMGEDGKPSAELLDLSNIENRNMVYNYIADNWTKIPQVKDKVQAELQRAFDIMASANPDEDWDWEERGWDKPYLPEDELGRETMAEILRVLGNSVSNQMDTPSYRRAGESTASVNIANMNQMWGHNAFEHLVAENFEKAIMAATEDLIGNNRALLLGPDVATLGEGILPSVDGDDESLANKIGFITSFDGTAFGDIESVKDLFSNGKIGPMDAHYFMDRLYNETRDGNGYSSLVAQIQQELYAWGYMGAPAEWGKLEIPGLVRGEAGATADPTTDALQMLQVDFLQEGLNTPKAELSPDGSAYLDTVINRSVARKLETLPGRGGQETGYLNAIESVIGGLDSLASRSGRTFSDEGKANVREKLKAQIKEMRDSPLGEDQEMFEEAFGGGGLPAQQAVADIAMRLFYQDENWDENVFIGANDSDFDYYRYAKQSGALSEEEIFAIENSPAWGSGTATKPFYQAGLNPGQFQKVPNVTTQDRGTVFNQMDVTYDDYVDPRAVTRKAARDVIVSFFLDLIQQQGEEAAVGESGSLANALNTFGHTLGARVGTDYAYTMRDYERMAREIREELALEPTPEQPELFRTLEERIAKANQLTGVNPQPFAQIANVISRRRNLTNMPTGRNQ